MNPYFVLNVAPEADDETIRHAYLTAIKSATPESDPARFKVLAEAYATVKDELSRHQREIAYFECPGQSPLDVFRRQVGFSPQPGPLSWEAMQSLLRSCAKT